MKFVHDPSAMTSELPLIRGGGGMDFIAIDLNRDGFTDFVANDSDWPNGRILTNIIGWVYQPDTGQYVESLAIRSDPMFSFPSLRSHVNDFNRDGLDDLYVVTYGDEHRQGAGGYDALFYSQPDGSFTDGRGTPLDRLQTWGHGTTTGDLNDDGFADILVSGGYGGNDNSYDSFILYNLGGAGFSAPQSLPGAHAMTRAVTPEIWAAEIADLNGDGRTDIITGQDAGPSTKGDRIGTNAGTPATIFFQRADSSYDEYPLPPGQLDPLNTDTVDIKAFDADGDGDLDLLLTNYYVGGWEQLADGTISYTGRSVGLDGQTPADMFSYGEVRYLINNGQGRFVDATHHLQQVNEVITTPGVGGSYFQGIHVIDIDADGDLDLFFFYGGYPLYEQPSNVWINDGAGHFTPLQNRDSFVFSGDADPMGPWGMWPFDYDKDGDWDFAWDQPSNYSLVDNVGYARFKFAENTTDTNGVFGGSSERDLLKGTALAETFYLYGGDDVVYAGAGDDAIYVTFGHDRVYGEEGLDTSYFSGLASAFEIDIEDNVVTVTDQLFSRYGSNQLYDVERLAFSDATIALDLEGGAGQAYRLYKAAFDRIPDQTGLGFWIAQMDAGASLTDAASGFVTSAEFQSMYGDGIGDADFVALLYENVLDRQPDASGYAYWLDAMAGGLSREQVLANFSESVENKANVADLIDQGIQYTAFIG